MATITVAAVSPKKSGAMNGRKWTLFEVRGRDDTTYSTFDAEWARHVGESVEATVSDRNRLGLFPKVAARPTANGTTPRASAPAAAAASPDRFAVLNEKLDRALDELAAIRRHFV